MIRYAKKELKLTDEGLLKGRMSDQLIDTINEVKLKHRTSMCYYQVINLFAKKRFFIE
jgi:hypothetical protein